MRGATFDELFERSKAFQALNVGKDRNFLNWESFDRDLARELWDNRYPKVAWDFCQSDGCHTLVEHGAYCGVHCGKSRKLPKWRWYRGILYRHLCENHNAKAGYRKNKWEYKDYLKYQTKQRFGEVPKGYEIVQSDGNFFNFHKTNIVLVSRISMAAVKSNTFALQDAMEMDKLIANFVSNKFKAGRKPFVTSFSYGDIAIAAGMRLSAVRKRVERGSFDPHNLSSIVKFVNKAKKVDN